MPSKSARAMRQESEFEPELGLPERLPAGEALLWQGSPSAWAMWRHVLHGTVLGAYFLLLLGWQLVSQLADGAPMADALLAAVRLVPLFAAALGLLAGVAWLAARTTVYTITSQRVVMRIGIVLTVAYNLPLRRVRAAHLHPLAGGHGDIALELEPGTRIAYLHLWPHARPWQIARPQPMLRCLAKAPEVAELLMRAWSNANAHSAPHSAAHSAAGSGSRPGALPDAPAAPNRALQPSA